MTRMPHGHCTLPADDAGRILALFGWNLEQVIPAGGRLPSPSGDPPNQSTTLQTCTDEGRSRRVVLAMGLLTESPIRHAFQHARRLRFGEESRHRSSLFAARQRLGIAPMRRRVRRYCSPAQGPDTPGGLLRRIPPDRGSTASSSMSPTPTSTRRPSDAPRPGRAATKPSSRSASSDWSSRGRMPRSPSSCAPSPMASRGWSAPCSAIWNPRCSCCGIAASSAMAWGKR